jgi:hypothetical protein
MRSPRTIGVELPFPGKANFQVTFSAFQEMGYLPFETLPLPLGPRQLGQLARARPAKPVSAAIASNITEMRLAEVNPKCMLGSK